LTGEETYDIAGIDDTLRPGAMLEVTVHPNNGTLKKFAARARIDTPVELEYYRNGGILQTVLRKLLDE
jgi:aconitate hydratase